LGRRNQNLLGRQLDFITELETNETDPDTLANLFRLDHLATRMRRNAESLLVLAGIEPPRKWAAPVRLTDVIRAALGEVEDYQRVTVRGVEPATILGAAAADLAHLLAELVENALVFSPPDQTVDIRGRHHPTRGRSRPDTNDDTERDLPRFGYTLAIIDSGLGMPHGDVTSANRRLAGAESFTIAPSKYLGHYVAGNLAHRHNITVHLDNTPNHGVTATIDLPPTLLTTDEGLGDPVTPPHGHQVALLSPEAQAARALAASRPALAPAAPGWDAYRPGRPAAPAAPPPAPAAPPVPAAGATTSGGLTKRNPRSGGGTTVGAGEPSGELLDALSRHTGRVDVVPGPDDAPPDGLWGPRESIARSPADPPPWGPPAGGDQPAWAAPAGGDQPTAWATPSGGDEPAWGGGDWASPPAPERPAWPTPAGGDEPAPWGAPQPGSDWAPAPAGPAADPWGTPAGWLPVTSSPSAPEAPAAEADTGATIGGLARRVRGAQLPTTEPLRVRRAGEGDPAGPRTAGRGSARQTRSAEDVYSFLSSFTAGVQRGLHEADNGE
ncbi:MAG TPA: ATP-binding protein, partial [Acidimicrobiales bacterium]|nr:ATP-binding protein [Acidimicrobiales bacterium]